VVHFSGLTAIVLRRVARASSLVRVIATSVYPARLRDQRGRANMRLAGLGCPDRAPQGCPCVIDGRGYCNIE